MKHETCASLKASEMLQCMILKDNILCMLSLIDIYIGHSGLQNLSCYLLMTMYTAYS